MKYADSTWTPPAGVQRGLLAAALAGGLLTLAGLAASPSATWAGVLMAAFLLTSLALAGPVLQSFALLARARWATAVRRIPEAMGATLPVAAGFALLLCLGLPLLYEWSHAATLAADPHAATRRFWLTIPGFVVRTAAAFLAWFLLERRLRAAIAAREAAGQPAAGARLLRAAALFVAVFAVTYSLLCYDWLMSLDAHWYSTIFAVYHLGGLASAGLAAGILLALYLERQGPLRGVLREDHLHDLAKLLFAFTLFWGYAWYCQYMLIWYTDIPEEVSWYAVRHEGHWWLLVRTTLALKWGVPFLLFLPRATCRSRKVVGRVAAIVLAGHLLDLWVHVGPSLGDGTSWPVLWALGPVLAGASLWTLVVLRRLGRMEAVPWRDPGLAWSLRYHTP